MDATKTIADTISGSGQNISIGAASASSTALPEGTQCVRLVATVDCFFEMGEAPTAAANTGVFLPAGNVEYWQCDKGDKIAVIQSIGAGTLYVSLMY